MHLTQGPKHYALVRMSTATVSARSNVGKLIFLEGDALGTTCAVPEKLVGPDLQVDFDQYLFSGWASRNCGLNPNAIGSHLYPKVPSKIVSPEIAARHKEKLRKIGRYAE